MSLPTFLKAPLVEALLRYDGRLPAVARALGMSRDTLERRLQYHGLTAHTVPSTRRVLSGGTGKRCPAHAHVWRQVEQRWHAGTWVCTRCPATKQIARRPS